jgi:hypothetical protein
MNEKKGTAHMKLRTCLLGLLLLGAVFFGGIRLAQPTHSSTIAIHSHNIAGGKPGGANHSQDIAGGKPIGGNHSQKIAGGKPVGGNHSQKIAGGKPSGGNHSQNIAWSSTTGGFRTA